MGPAGSKVVDPSFGSTILRLTDGADGGDCIVEYAYWPVVNKDSTRLMVLCAAVKGGSYFARFYPFNATAFTISSGTTLSSTPGESVKQADAMWSGLDPDLMWFHSDTKLYSYQVATKVWTLVKDLSGVLPSGGRLQQMSRSVNDNVFGWHMTGGSFLAWTRSTNTTFIRSVSTINEVQVDKSGRYMTVILQSGSPQVWDMQTGTMTQLTQGVDGFFHYDSGFAGLFNVNDSYAAAYRQLATPHTLVMSLMASLAARRKITTAPCRLIMRSGRSSAGSTRLVVASPGPLTTKSSRSRPTAADRCAGSCTIGACGTIITTSPMPTSAGTASSWRSRAIGATAVVGAMYTWYVFLQRTRVCHACTGLLSRPG